MRCDVSKCCEFKMIDKSSSNSDIGMPEEYTQMRRNGDIYVSCHVFPVSGEPTIRDSGLKVNHSLVTSSKRVRG